MPTATNGTTNAILSFLQFNGACAHRNSTMGTWDAKTNRYRTCHPSAVGSGDILACIKGSWLEIEIKTGSDSMSPAQLRRKEWVEHAGGMYWVVKTFDEFIRLIDKHNLRRK